MVHNFDEIEEKNIIIERMLIETILEDCLQFIKLFNLPNSIELLENLMYLIYNSFSLPDYKSKYLIDKIIVNFLQDKLLIAQQTGFYFLPGTIEQTLIKNMLRSKLEFVNGNLMDFLEKLLVQSDQSQLSLNQVLDIYTVISEEFYNVKSLFSLHEKTELSGHGERYVKKKAWNSLHDRNFELVFEYLSDNRLFSQYFNNFFKILHETGEFFTFLCQEEDECE